MGRPAGASAPVRRPCSSGGLERPAVLEHRVLPTVPPRAPGGRVPGLCIDRIYRFVHTSVFIPGGWYERFGSYGMNVRGVCQAAGMNSLRVVFRADPEDYERWKRDARNKGMSFGEHVRQLLNHAGVTAVREPPSSVAVPPQARLPSAPVGAARVSARDMAVRGGKCSADVAFGSRCKLCGEVHR